MSELLIALSSASLVAFAIGATWVLSSQQWARTAGVIMLWISGFIAVVIVFTTKGALAGFVACVIGLLVAWVLKQLPELIHKK